MTRVCSKTTDLTFEPRSSWAPLVAQMVKNPPASAGDLGSGRFFGGGYAKPPQHSCLENPMDRGSWQATIHGVSGSDAAEVT